MLGELLHADGAEVIGLVVLVHYLYVLVVGFAVLAHALHALGHDGLFGDCQ